MILCDINVLVFASRSDSVEHERYANWLGDVVNGPSLFGVSTLALSGLLRLVTNRRIYQMPTPLPVALDFCRSLLQAPNAVEVRPGPRHWAIFDELCERVGASSNLIPDAYFAALAIEHGCEWITTDRDFARFPGLRWRHPLEG